MHTKDGPQPVRVGYTVFLVSSKYWLNLTFVAGMLWYQFIFNCISISDETPIYKRPRDRWTPSAKADNLFRNSNKQRRVSMDTSKEYLSSVYVYYWWYPRLQYCKPALYIHDIVLEPPCVCCISDLFTEVLSLMINIVVFDENKLNGKYYYHGPCSKSIQVKLSASVWLLPNIYIYKERSSKFSWYP